MSAPAVLFGFRPVPIPRRFLALLVACAVLGAGSAAAQDVVGTIDVSQPRAVAVYETGNRVFVASDTTGNVYTYDGTTLAQLNAVYVGTAVWAMAVHEGSGKLFVLSRSPTKVAVLNAATGAFIQYLPGSYSMGFCLAVDEALGKVYALNPEGLHQIDVWTLAVTSVLGAGGASIAVNPVTHQVFTLSSIDLTIVDGISLAQTTIDSIQGYGVAVNWIDNKVYAGYCATDASGHPQPCIYDLDTATKTILATPGQDATAIFYNPAGNRVYTSAEVNEISTVIEGATDAYRTIPLDGATTGFGARTLTNHVYLAGPSFVAVVDDATLMVEKIPVNNPSPSGTIITEIAVNQTTGRVYVINDNDYPHVTVIQDHEKLTRQPVFLSSPGGFKRIHIYDPGTESVVDKASTPVGALTAVTLVAPGGARYYGGRDFFGGFLVTYAGFGQRAELSQLATGAEPPDVSLPAPDGTRIYGARQSADDVVVIDLVANAVVGTIPVGNGPWGMAFTPGGQKLYVANEYGGTVSVIATATNTVVATIPVGAGSLAVVVSPSGRTAYVANSNAGTVSVINTATDTVATTIAVGSTPYGVACSPDGTRVYVTNRGSGTMSVIDTGTNTVIGTVTGLGTPKGIDVMPDGSRIYVASSAGFDAQGYVHVVDPADFSTTTVMLPTDAKGTHGVAIANNMARIAGQVTPSGGGGGMGGVLVRALQGAVEKGTATTNAAGDFAIPNLLPGSYDLEFSAAGYETQTVAGVTVGAGRTETRFVQLSPSTPIAPVASFTASPNPCACGQSVSFDASGSYHPNPARSIVSYAWDFGDAWTANGVLVSHAYAAFGAYTVRLTVTDNSSPPQTATTTVLVNVNQGNLAPVGAHGGPYTADLGGGLSLDGSGSSDPDAGCGDSIVSYAWLIAGSIALSGPTPSLTPAQVTALGVGTFTVQLTVTDSFGATGTASTTLTVYDNRPFASFTAGPNPCGCGQLVTFDASGSSHGRPDRSIVSYAWSFGDGTTGSGRVTTHAFAAFGSYLVTLTVTDNNVPPTSATTTAAVVVNQGNRAPVAVHNGPYSVALGTGVSLSAAGSADPDAGCGDSIVSYAWSVAGSLTLSGASPSLTAAQVDSLGAGTHAVVLTVTDTFGAAGTGSTTLTISRGGSAWSKADYPGHIPTQETLRSVHFPIASEGWAAGYAGAIVHTSDGGTSWTAQTSCTDQRLLAVHFVDATTGWAQAGRQVCRTTDAGAHWASVAVDPTALKFRNALFAVSATQAWVPVSSSGVPTQTRWFDRLTIQGDGSLSEQSFDVMQSAASFFDVFFTDPDNGWSVGTNGQIRRITNASTGSPAFAWQASGTTAQLNGVFMLDASTGWIAGNGGTVLKTTDGGATWSPLAPGTTANLRDVYFTDAQTGWVVGEGGVIRHTTDGGASWTPEASGVSTTLWSVWFAGSAGFAAGGDLSGGSNGALLKRSSVALPAVAFASASSSAAEAGGVHAVAVTLTTPDGNPTTSQVTVQYVTADGTASAGSDYSAVLSTLTFPPGSASGSTASIGLSILPDTIAEGDETFTVTLQHPTGASVGTPGAHTVTILDADTTPPEVAVLSPNGGEKVFAGASYLITWSASDDDVVSFFDVFFSVNAGGSYAPVPGCTNVAGSARSCAWSAPGPATAAGRIRVVAHDASGNVAADSSDWDYSVVSGTPSITVTAPNTAVTWPIGATRQITWNHNLGARAYVRIEIRRASGAPWEEIVASVKNTGGTTGTFSWAVTGPASAHARVRVQWVNGPASDTSNADFTIAQPVITVTQPNTAVSWPAGTVKQVKWTHNLGAAATFRVELSRNGGATYTEVIAAAAPAATSTSGSFNWTVTWPVASAARVRVAWNANPAAADASNVNFSIVNPSITVSAPAGTANWGYGTRRKVTWSTNLGSADRVDVLLSVDGGTSFPYVLASNVTASNKTATVTLPALAAPTSQARVRVEWVANPAIGGTSPANFQVGPPSVVVTKPNGPPALWTVGSTREITWTSNLGTLEGVKVELSTDGGATWGVVLLANTPSDGTQSVVVQAAWITTQARVRITWLRDASVSDVSNLDFEIR